MKDILQKSSILLKKYEKLFDQFGYLVDSNCEELAKNKIKRLQGAYKMRDSKMCNKIIDDLNQTIFRLSFKKEEDLSMFSNFGVFLFTWRKLSEPHLLNSTNYLKSVQHFNSFVNEMKNDTENIIVKLSSVYAELMEPGTFVSDGIQCAECGTINTPFEIYCQNEDCGVSWIENLNFEILYE